jgi:hypothetical protein
MGLPILGAENEMPDNDPHVPGVIAGKAGGFSVWSPRLPVRFPISLSAIGYNNPAYSLTAQSGCPTDRVHRQDRRDARSDWILDGLQYTNKA